MKKNLIQENVIIYEFPQVSKCHFNTITIGDLHGNAVKFLYFLLHHGVVKFKKGIDAKKAFDKFVALYKALPEILDDLEYSESSIRLDLEAIKRVTNIDSILQLGTSIHESVQSVLNKKQEIKRNTPFNELYTVSQALCRIERSYNALRQAPEKLNKNTKEFDEIVTHLTVSNKEILVRFIGDEFADRGSSDYYTFRLFRLLHEQKVRFSILMSNHGKEFLTHVLEELSKDNESADAYDYEYKIALYQQKSWNGLKHILQIVEEPKILIQSFLDEIYIPNLKLIDYSLSEDNQSITLFTHAPTNLSKIKEIASLFDVFYNDRDPKDLTQTIDNINEHFREKLKNDEVFRKRFFTKQGIPVLEDFYWNRKIQNLWQTDSSHQYAITYVFGHIGEIRARKLPKNAISLDTNCGKLAIDSQDHAQKQKYKVFVANVFGLEKQGALSPIKPYFTIIGATFGAIIVGMLSVLFLPVTTPLWAFAATIFLGTILTIAAGALIDEFRKYKHFKNKENLINQEIAEDKSNSTYERAVLPRVDIESMPEASSHSKASQRFFDRLPESQAKTDLGPTNDNSSISP